MKKVFGLIAALLVTASVSAKKVKFAVDMGSNLINASGVHLIGDFQVKAGFGTIDWDPSTMQLSQEGSSTIYSIIVNLPAFNKYEFKFVNGIQTYEAEFVPEESRVGYNFNDNRWLYLDSLANDTTFAGAVLFGGNAPSGKSLIRYKVDLTTAGTVSGNGVHVGTSYQSFSPTKTKMYSFGNNVFEIINYVANASYGYIYYNGNQAVNTETVPGSCSVSGYRGINVSKDTVLNAVCFSDCVACIGAGIKQNNSTVYSINLFPNPATTYLTVRTNMTEKYALSLRDNVGRLVKNTQLVNSPETVIDLKGIAPGIYALMILSENGSYQTKKVIVE